MVEVKNKVVFMPRSAAGINKDYQVSSNMQGKLKKKIKTLKKLKIAEKITVLITGNYKEFEVKIDPADSKHAPKIREMLNIK